MKIVVKKPFEIKLTFRNAENNFWKPTSEVDLEF